MIQIKHGQEQIGFDYTIAKNPKYSINALIVDTENTFR